MPNPRLLIVDDSVVVRQLLSKTLDSDPELDVVGVAANGAIALAKIPQVNPDLIILDLEMPEMDGLATLTVIRQDYPLLNVIMFSSLTERGAEATLEALALGAKDYVTKPISRSKNEAIQYIKSQLIPKIKVFCPAPTLNRVLSSQSIRAESRLPQMAHASFGASSTGISPKRNRQTYPPAQIIAIGVSTGGPNALAEVLPRFPADFPVPIVIVQHMPPLFTRRLAQSLDAQCQIQVGEGSHGTPLKAGTAWIAPGDFHMEVERQGTQVILKTHQGHPENSCRPSVDVLFRSVSHVYGAGALGIVLTGMGQDGLHGSACIDETGGQILVQDEASSVVWGMPGIVANANLADKVVPLNQLLEEVQMRIMAN